MTTVLFSAHTSASQRYLKRVPDRQFPPLVSILSHYRRIVKTRYRTLGLGLRLHVYGTSSRLPPTSQSPIRRKPIRTGLVALPSFVTRHMDMGDVDHLRCQAFSLFYSVSAKLFPLHHPLLFPRIPSDIKFTHGQSTELLRDLPQKYHRGTGL